MANNIQTVNDEISLRELVLKTKRGFAYLGSRWKVILFFGLIGAVLGAGYAFFSKSQYRAVCTFVLDDGAKSSGFSQYAGLASLAGIDIGGGGSGGLFQGDNILELYKSRVMIENTLLSEVTFGNKKQMLIDRYIEFNKLRDTWKQNPGLNNIVFTGDPANFNRSQDSIITELVTTINKSVLNVSKPDKKLNIINVEVLSKDELFAKQFTDKLVETVNNFYIQTKTGKTTKSVAIFQRQADSIRNLLNSSLRGVASSIDATPNANPALQILKVPSQRKQVDVQASSAMYTEIVKNLEISKMALLQETPLIQVIDKPVLPLEKDRTSKTKATIVGGIIAILLAVIVILVAKIFKMIMSEA